MARLLAQTVEATDTSLQATLRLRYGVFAQPETRTEFPDSGPARSIVDRVFISVADDGNPQAALVTVRLAMTAADRRTIITHLAALRAKTRFRATAESDIETEFAAYEVELARYPADVMAQALREQADASPFFPAWAELRARLERLVARRRALLAAVERFRPRGADTASGQGWRDMSDEDRAAFERRMRETLAALRDRA